VEKKDKPLYPFISIVLIIGTLLGVVFLQMEERRRGYELLRSEKEFRALKEQSSQKKSQLARLIRPEHIEAIAGSQGSLQKIQNQQIIHLTGVR
jgi:cell division protein FtsL